LNKRHMRFILAVILILLMLGGAVFPATGAQMPVQHTEADELTEVTMRALVLAVEERPVTDQFYQTQWVTLEIYTGSLKGTVMTVENHLSDHPVYDIPVEPGDRVLVIQEDYAPGETEFYIIDYVRDTTILWIVLVFLAMLLIIGRWKGFKTILTLAITFFMIIRVLLPGLLNGYPPIPLTIGVSFVITLATIILINGINVKSVAAVTGIFGGLLAAGLVMFIVGSQVRLTGMSSEEAIMLLYIPQAVAFDFRDLLFAGIIMGALGAVMDVGISIASSMTEIYRVNPRITFRRLMTSGMNVGRDIMTTMSNTLILAYTGAALPLLLLFMAYGTPPVRILNMDLIATEIIRALSGSIGLLLTIPLTVVVSALLLKRASESFK
jgi:uncharacterized membrane protein